MGHQMELRHLRYFVAVAAALNFTRAAARLHLAQPALSRQVADLEEELGVDLLKRTSHGVRLTEEGKLFLEEARGLLKGAEESIRNASTGAPLGIFLTRFSSWLGSTSMTSSAPPES